jgi:hypothetical protein
VKTTMLIWILIVAVAIISSVIKRINKASQSGSSNYKKPNQPQHKTTYNKPQHTQPKSLEDILQNLLGEQKPAKKQVEQTLQPPIIADKQPTKFTTLEETTTLENIDQDHYKGEDKYYGLDTELGYEEEDKKDFDYVKDHRVHRSGFDGGIKEITEEESEWSNIDWRKAVITAEILRRPEY